MKKHALKSIVIYATLALLMSSCVSQKAELDFIFLDTNKDGIINPYEALDVLRQMQEQTGKVLFVSEFNELIHVIEKSRNEDDTEMFSDFDKNGDGEIQFEEVDEDMIELIEAMDTNSNKSVDLTEMSSFNLTEFYLLNDEEIKIRVEETFKEYNAVDEIKLTDVKKEKKSRYEEWDGNGDKRISKNEMIHFLRADNIPVKFEIIEDTAYMTGVITSELPTTVLELLIEQPNISFIEMITVLGSIDDVANIRASLLINKFGIPTKLNANSLVASGGTDFSFAGKKDC